MIIFSEKHFAMVFLEKIDKYISELSSRTVFLIGVGSTLVIVAMFLISFNYPVFAVSIFMLLVGMMFGGAIQKHSSKLEGEEENQNT